MKNKQRKTGGAYRRKQQMMTLHAKPGKDRTKSRKNGNAGKKTERN